MHLLAYIVTKFLPGRSHFITIILALIAVGALLLLVANIGNVVDYEGEPILGPSGHLLASNIAQILFLLWIALFVYFLIVNFRMKRGTLRDVESTGRSSWGWPIAILGLIAFIVMLKLLSGIVDDPDGSGDGGGGDGTGEIIPGTGGGGPESYIVYLVTIIIIAVVAYVLLREIWQRGRRSERLVSRGEVKAIIDDAVDSLESGDDPRSVVYRSYLRMCNLLEKKGLVDISYMTPGEFATVAVREFHLPRSQVVELTRLFEEARYSDHDVGEGMKERSIRCLGAVSEALKFDAEGAVGS